MQKILNFVKGAVSTKDLIPVLTNFHFYDGRVQGGNGRVTIDAPLRLMDVDITVPAVPLFRAIAACDGEPEFSITEGGRLSVRRGKFKSIIPLSNAADFPRVRFNSDDNVLWRPVPGLLRTLQIIRPFIGDDASRPWACGALFKGGYAYGTNNVVMARIPWPMPETICINIPAFAIDEILRINEEPDGMMFTETAAVFTYGDKWLQTQLFATLWPDVDKYFTDRILDPVPAGLLAAVQKVLPFCADPKFPTLHIDASGVHTAEGDMKASVEGHVLPTGRYRAETLQVALSCATHIDLAAYPGPVPFAGQNGLQGVLVGIK